MSVKYSFLFVYLVLLASLTSACSTKLKTPASQNKIEVSPPGRPSVQLIVSSTAVKPGELVTATVTVANIDSPTYFLVMRDSGVSVASKILGVTDENIVLPGTRNSNVLECISAVGRASQAVFVLRALLGGTTELWVSVLPGNTLEGKGWLSQVVQLKVDQ